MSILVIFILSTLINGKYSFEYFSSDPDIDRNSSQLIQSRGFICETHNVITDDAYVLTIFRIITPRFNDSRGYPIYLQHGFFQNSDNWLIASPGHLDSDGVYIEDNGIINQCSSNSSSVARTLPFVLSSCGYDVWLGNIRGNRYSSHLFLNPDSDMDYWNFTMDHFTKYDIVAAIDYVLGVTNNDNLGYIGYSLGTTIMFQLLSSKPQYSVIVKPFISLGPFVYIGHLLSPLLRIATVFEQILSAEAKPLARLGNLSQLIGRYFCGYSMFTQLCAIFGFLFGGFDYPMLNITQIPRVFAHFPDSSSSIALSHVGQRIMNLNFSYYSYSPDINRQLYGQELAPNYDLTKINSQHIVIMQGLNDWIADTVDVDILINQLKG